MSELLCFKLDIPRGDGVGPSIDVADADGPKTFVYQGARAGRFVVEGSHDGDNWAMLAGRDRAVSLFTGARPIARTVEGIAKHLRVRALGTRGVALPDSIGVGALPALAENVFATIAAPTDAGLGKPVDLGDEVGLDKTIILGGRLPPGVRYSLLASLDGDRFGEILRLPSGPQDRARTIAAVCRYLRIEKVGRGASPVVTIGAKGLVGDSGDSGGGEPSGGSTRSQVSLSDEAAVMTDLASDEQVVREYFVPLTAVSERRGFEATLAGLFGAEGPGSGEALFRLRMGGKPGRPDGETLVEIEERTAGSARSVTERVRTKPSEAATLVKLTAQSSGKVRAVARGVVITFHPLP
jgi:hypothetical protein